MVFSQPCPPNGWPQPRAPRDGFRDLALRFVRLVGCSASFTARSVGNASATSGSISTMFVPARARRTYLPRTPPFMDAKSYSARMSSAGIGFVFFIKLLLMPCGGSCVDGSDRVGGLSVRHHQA